MKLHIQKQILLLTTNDKYNLHILSLIIWEINMIHDKQVAQARGQEKSI